MQKSRFTVYSEAVFVKKTFSKKYEIILDKHGLPCYSI